MRSLTEDLLGAELLDDRLKLLRVADKVDMEAADIGKSREDVKVVDNVAEVRGDYDGRGSIAQVADGLVGRLESVLDLGPEIKDENRLVNLYALSTGSLERLQKLDIDRHELVKESDGVDGRATVSLAESKEGHGAEQHRPGLEASLLGLEEFPYGLGIGSKGEGLVILQGGLDIVVVGVEPLDHLKGRDIYTSLLMTTAHGKVLIEWRQLL
jgi:hypothetical protein